MSIIYASISHLLSEGLFFSIISMDQIFQVARQASCCTLATQDPWDIPLLLLGMLGPGSPQRLDPAPRRKPGLEAPNQGAG